MKLKNIIIHTMAAVTLLTACELERNPLDKFSENTFWSSEDNAQLALTGIYRTNTTYNTPEYSPSDWWAYGGLIFLDFCTDNGYDRRGTNSNFYKMTDGTLLANNPFTLNYWNNSYTKIARANRFLEGIDQLHASSAARFKAEARFLRATQYFYLSQFFGDVPLVTNSLTREEANNVLRNTKAQLIDFVVTELTEAAKDLPRFSELKATEAGRASKQAALAFLGRTLLAEKRYAEAAKVYEEIISFGDNSIDPDYASIFLPANKNSKENIFTMQYMQDMAGNALPQHAFPRADGGWCLVNVDGSLFEAYEFKDGSSFSYDSPLYNPNNLGENRDPRLDYTLLYDGCTFRGHLYVCHPDAADSPDRVAGGQTTQTGFMMRKFLDESYNGDLNSYGTNMPVIRYAEVLLSYLEAKLEAGEGITQSLLDETINKVRSRASVNMPPVKETNPEKLRPILRNERRVEMAMEGTRYWDLLRWGTAHEALNADIYGAPFPGSIRKSLKDGKEDKYGRWYVGHRSFRKDKDYQWPIPQSEQDINPNLR